MRTPHLARPTLASAVAAATAAIAVAALAGCNIAQQRSQVAPSPITSAATPPPAGQAGDAASQLDELTIATSSSTRGYSRDRFPHWRKTGTNCDIRDAVLKRDGERLGPVELSGCNVVGGRWLSPYDGKEFTDPADVDIDHMVPLANAWRSGADAWDDQRRGDFANDISRPQLLAVSASSNRSKGDQDPSQWRPPDRSYWCRYARDWIAVKHYWRLTVTSAEKAALGDMIATCR